MAAEGAKEATEEHPAIQARIQSAHQRQVEGLAEGPEVMVGTAVLEVPLAARLLVASAKTPLPAVPAGVAAAQV
jgi:hypothetical protein